MVVDLKMSAPGKKPIEASRQLSGLRFDHARGRMWVGSGPADLALALAMCTTRHWLLLSVAVIPENPGTIDQDAFRSALLAPPKESLVE